jgi:4-amino-4-deoxy-L-arabinose transferase-like glycosyltransferase
MFETKSEPFECDERSLMRNGTPRTRGWLVFALLLFSFQVIPYLSHRWVMDESWYSAPAYSIAHGNGVKNPAIGSNDTENQVDARPPGTAVVISAAFVLFGESQISARLGSILAGFVVVFLTYRLARDVIGESGALLATFLVATDNLIVLTSRTARPEALTVMAILASLLAMKQYALKRHFVWAWLSGLSIAMGTMFHITVLGFIVSFGVLAIVLDRRHADYPLHGAFAYILGYVVGVLPFVFWLSSTRMGRAGFSEEYLSRAHDPIWQKFLGEGHRYFDLLGINVLHGHGMGSFPVDLKYIPVRLPIPLFFLAASCLLWQYRRQWFNLELLLLVPTLLWLVCTVSKSSRYLALLGPVFAWVIAGAFAATAHNHTLHRLALGFSILVVVAQLSANLLLLHAARNADYDKVSAELRDVIPNDENVYGSITFWLGLRDHPFISAERTDLPRAISQFHAGYLIVDDGLRSDEAVREVTFYKALTQPLSELESHAAMVGHFSDSYYGDLKVYKLP